MTDFPTLAPHLKSERAYQIHTVQADFTPQVAALADMLTYARLTTLQAASGLTAGELAFVPAGLTNSVGMLLAHISAVHRIYHGLSFEGRDVYEEEAFAPYRAALDLGEAAQEAVRGRDLAWFEAELQASLNLTLAGLAARDDDWLLRLCLPDQPMNNHWAWFHVMEDEVSHRGQMRLIRRLLPPREVGAGAEAGA